MGLIGRILSFVRAQRNGAQISDVKTDPGGGPNVTAEHFAPAGDDAHPLPGDYVYGAPSPQRGRYAAVGYVDPANQSKAQPGEKRIYARDSDGQQVGEVWLQADGTIAVENENGSMTLGPNGSILGQNAAGSFELQAAGAFVVNGVTIGTDGKITTPTGIVTPSAVVDSVEVAGHNHTQPADSSGDTEQPTNPMQEP